jgi:hypothetical protein
VLGVVADRTFGVNGDLQVVALLRVWLAAERQRVRLLGIQIVAAARGILADEDRSKVARDDLVPSVLRRILVLERDSGVQITLVVAVELDDEATALVRVVVRRPALDVDVFDLDCAVVARRIPPVVARLVARIAAVGVLSSRLVRRRRGQAHERDTAEY